MIDIGLSIDNQAQAVLQMLRGYDGNFADIEGLHGLSTFAWYNGRERGISLVAHHTSAKTDSLVIVFGEIRNTDGIFVDVYEDSHASTMSCPTWEDPGYTAAWENRNSFSYGAAGKVAQFVLKTIEKWVKQANREAKAA